MSLLEALRFSLAFQHPAFAGGHRGAEIPVPIPNTEVKGPIAEGSASLGRARVGRRRLFYFLFSPSRRGTPLAPASRLTSFGGYARSVSFTSDLVAPFALRQSTSLSLPCLGIYHWLRAKFLIRRRVLRIPHSRHPFAPATSYASLVKGRASRCAEAKLFYLG